jgi:primosomal protein N'
MQLMVQRDPRRYCEVALPVPLRSTFTYAIPAAMNGDEMVGRRVVVPFRNRAMVGVALSQSDRPPKEADRKKSFKEIVELMDPLPALPPKLIELGEWISRYYLAPIGETFRAMLPPEVEIRHDREYSLTDQGREHVRQLSLSGEDSEVENSISNFLRRIERQGGTASSMEARKWLGDEAAVEDLVRRGYLQARTVLRKRTRPRMTPKAESKRCSPRLAALCPCRFSQPKPLFRAP